MNEQWKDILDRLETFREGAEALRELILANLVMLGEIPAKTFRESGRIRFLMDRFAECGLQSSSRDEAGNGQGIIPGNDSGRNILVLAHADTVHNERMDHTISVHSDRVVGPGVADNSLGLAVLTSLPSILQHLNIHLDANLILMGGVKSLGRGDLEGLRFFLDNNKLPIDAAICIEGVPLGRLSIGSIGMLRGEIICRVPEEYDWTRFGATGAILTMNDVINKITAIALPRKPRTHIMLGSIRGGTSYNTTASLASLRFEIRSESEELVLSIGQKIKEITEEISYQTKSSVELNVIARRKPGGIPFGHPMAQCGRSILQNLQIDPRISPSTSELSALIDASIPAVTIGITEGENLNEVNETVFIGQMSTGIAQLIGLILAADGGFCNEP